MNTGGKWAIFFVVVLLLVLGVILYAYYSNKIPTGTPASGTGTGTGSGTGTGIDSQCSAGYHKDSDSGECVATDTGCPNVCLASTRCDPGTQRCVPIKTGLCSDRCKSDSDCQTSRCPSCLNGRCNPAPVVNCSKVGIPTDGTYQLQSLRSRGVVTMVGNPTRLLVRKYLASTDEYVQDFLILDGKINIPGVVLSVTDTMLTGQPSDLGWKFTPSKDGARSIWKIDTYGIISNGSFAWGANESGFLVPVRYRNNLCKSKPTVFRALSKNDVECSDIQPMVAGDVRIRAQTSGKYLRVDSTDFGQSHIPVLSDATYETASIFNLRLSPTDKTKFSLKTNILISKSIHADIYLTWGMFSSNPSLVGTRLNVASMCPKSGDDFCYGPDKQGLWSMTTCGAIFGRLPTDFAPGLKLISSVVNTKNIEKGRAALSETFGLRPTESVDLFTMVTGGKPRF